jgi:hypothetical protein
MDEPSDSFTLRQKAVGIVAVATILVFLIWRLL